MMRNVPPKHPSKCEPKRCYNREENNLNLFGLVNKCTGKSITLEQKTITLLHFVPFHCTLSSGRTLQCTYKIYQLATHVYYAETVKTLSAYCY